MKFAWRLAWRETRAAWARLLFFFLCVALGVAAIVVLRSTMQQVRAALTGEARDLVGGDVVLRSSAPWTPAERGRIAATLGGDGLVATEAVETQTMATRREHDAVAATRLVEVRAMAPGFPAYGTIELADGRTYSHALVTNHGALVQPELLAHLGVGVGDSVWLGGARFTIRGVVARDRLQRSGGFALGPRVYVDLADLSQSGLIGFGSRATHELFLRVAPAKIDALTDRLRAAFKNDLVNVRSWRGVEDRLGRNLTLAENYLSLVGFAIVVLGGVGVWSVARVFVQQKVKSVAILKCLGATWRTIVATYVIQILWLALCGSVLGVGIGALGLAAIPARWLAPWGVAHVSLTWSAAGQGIAVGLLVSLAFAVVPLLEMREIKPLLLLRADTAPGARRRDWLSWLARLAMVATLVVVAVWQASSWRAGIYVCLGLAVVGLALAGASDWLIRATAPLVRSRRFAIRHAAMSLGRPGNQTRVVLLAVGLGCFFVLGMRALQVNLLAELEGQIGRDAPDLVLIDVQPDQVNGVRQAVAPQARGAANFWPMIRARVVGVEGREVTLATPDAVRAQGKLTREFGVTYRDALEPNEQVQAGTFWTSSLTTSRTPDGADTDVSIEETIHDEAHVDLGDLVRFDIGGRVLSARVSSIRKVTWDQTQNGGFMFVLRPGPSVVSLPQTFVGFLQVPPGPEATAVLERRLVQAYPNVSVIDVRDILATLREVVDDAAVGVSVIGGISARRRRSDVGGRRGDDEVPTAVRSGHLPDARRRHPAARGDDGDRIRLAGPAGGGARRGRRPRAVLAGGDAAARDRVARAAVDADRRRGGDGRHGRSRWRGRERRRAREEAARDAAERVAGREAK